MEKTTNDLLLSQSVEQSIDVAFMELTDLQLAVVGGGCGETVL